MIGGEIKIRTLDELKKNSILKIQELGQDGGCAFIFFGQKRATVVFSWGEGWDRVSVSFRTRCPIWDEMCTVKDIFWGEDECVIQYHPPKKDYVNFYPYALHMWKPQGQDVPRPPKYMVG